MSIERKEFFLRLGLSYLVVPLLPPTLLMIWSRQFGEWIGLLMIYGIFGVAAMLALGTPLLFFYLRLGWTGFVPFMAGGGLCAAITSYAVLRGDRTYAMVVFFTISGLLCGLLFRVILFGLRRSQQQRPIRTRTVVTALVLTAATVITGAFLFFLYSVSDEHRSVTEQMGWECVSAEDTKDSRFPHVETVKMWFLRNPHFEERATGPHLCSDLQAAGQSQVAVTFNVWGNRVKGLHGYDGAAISTGSKNVQFYEFGSGGFHGDASIGNYNSADHPEVYRFPLEVFK